MRERVGFGAFHPGLMVDREVVNPGWIEVCAFPPLRQKGAARMGHGQDGEIYVVARGLTAIAVAGTEPETGVVIRHPGSEPGVHGGRFGLICSVSA